MNERKIEYIEKAALTLIKDETISEFQSVLIEAIKLKFGSKKDESNMILLQVQAKQVVFDEYKEKEGIQLYAVDYYRDVKTGNFTFGTPIKVQRRTSYIPV